MPPEEGALGCLSSGAAPDRCGGGTEVSSVMWEGVCHVGVGRRRQGRKEVPLEPGQPRLVDRVTELMLPARQLLLSWSPALAHRAQAESQSIIQWS